MLETALRDTVIDPTGLYETRGCTGFDWIEGEFVACRGIGIPVK